MKTIILAILIFCVLVFIHEFGHFAAAKACGVKVNRFALGMGPALLKKQKGETEYSLRVFPIGGFCEMEGEDGDSDEPRSFSSKKPWQKAVILAAGPLMNVVLAFVVMVFVLFFIGSATTTVESVIEESPAEEVGIEAGDTLLEIDGMAIDEWEDVSRAISASEAADGTGEVSVVLERDGETLTLSCGTMEESGRQILGVTSHREKSAGDAILKAPGETFGLLKQMLLALKMLLTGEASVSDLSGPVGIVYVVDQTASAGMLNVLYLMAFLSMNLAVVNLLPFPALDGGRLLFVGLRKITRGKISEEAEAKVNYVGILLLFSLMIYVTWNDIVRFIVPLFS